MKTFKLNYIVALLALIAIPFITLAQTAYVLTQGGEVSVSGTSSLHDWTMTGNKMSGDALISIDQEFTGIQNMNVAIFAESLKSGKSGMDNNAYKALNTKKYPQILFSLKKINSITEKNGYYLVDAEGTLTIAGTSKVINLQAKAYPDGSVIKFQGSKAFKMTDFDVTPPSLMMGTIKTGDAITVNYNFTFKTNKLYNNETLN